MSEPTTPFAKTAPAWRKGGWQGTIWLPPREKYPPPAGYTGRDGRWPTDADIETWMTIPDANIGLRLPEMIVGLDLDLYKPGAHAAYDQLVAKLGPLPPTWRITSRDDGVSGVRLYRLAKPTKLRSVIDGIGETIRHGHRYLVLPGSLHPAPPHRPYVMFGPDGELTDMPPRPDDLFRLS